MFSLEHRTILLTGAAGYLGGAMGREILRAGASLLAVGRDEGKLTVFRDDLPSDERARCHICMADVSDEESIKALASDVAERFGRLHGLVNNAYAGKVGVIEAIETHDFVEACQLNLIAPFLLARAFVDAMKKGARERQRASSIVNVSSMYGKVSPNPSLYGNSGNNNPAHYGATKAGMLQLTRYLACNLSPDLIRVNSVSPGPFPNLPRTPSSEPFLTELRDRVPIGRVGGASEIAGPVVFLLSDAASYVTGADLAVDGGWTAW